MSDSAQRRNQDQTEELPPLQHYQSLDDLPIKYQQRTCTDIFCIGFGIVFTLLLIILSFVLFNYGTIFYNFPTDSDGKLCGAQLPSYPYVYFANLPQIARRVCVAECPKAGDTSLNCYSTQNVGCRFTSTPGFQVNYYDNEADDSRIGHFCFPTDQKMKEDLLIKTELQDKYVFINSVDVVGMCCLLSLGLSILYVILTQCFPKFMNKVVVFIGMIMTLVLTICLFIYPSNSGLKIIIALFFLLMFVVIVFNYISNRKTFEMQGVFLESATKMLGGDRKFSYLYIIGFLVCTFLFTLILLAELKAFLGGGSLHFDNEESIFWEFSNSNSFLVFLIIIQAIWGYTFLKQSFNFCISGNTTSWYYGADWACYQPLKILLFKHFGSVVAGSFMTGFFSLGDYLFDLIKPKNEDDSGCYASCFNFACAACTKVFDLVRSDSMAYINAAGIPYCNSARYCEYLTDKSLLLDGSQSASRTYRICAHLAIASFVGILGLYLKGTITASIILFIVFASLIISTFFISIHADAAQALIILFLNNEEIEMRALLRERKGSRKDPKHFSKISWRQPELKEQIEKMREEERLEKANSQ